MPNFSSAAAAGSDPGITGSQLGTWIALLRGINVGGNNILPMAELRNDLEALKLTNVRTYIQSGNVVFDSAATTPSALAKRIGEQIEEQHGFRPRVLILSREDFLAAIETNPFPEAASHPKTLHFFFLAEPAADANMQALDDARSPTEAYKLTDRVFYLHAPDGIGRSKLAAKVERHLRVVTTARNYRTCAGKGPWGSPMSPRQSRGCEQGFAARTGTQTSRSRADT